MIDRPYTDSFSYQLFIFRRAIFWKAKEEQIFKDILPGYLDGAML
jgi:hypothetical protein